MTRSLAYRLGVLYELTLYSRDIVRKEDNVGRFESYLIGFIVALTTEVVVDTIESAVQSISADPQRYYQRYWWRYYEHSEPQYDVQPPEQPEQQDVWPPFTGVRKELGSDIV